MWRWVVIGLVAFVAIVALDVGTVEAGKEWCRNCLAVSGVMQDSGEGQSTPLDALSDYALYAALLGFVGTYVAAFINRQHWPDYLRFGTFFVYSVVAAAGDAYVARELDWSNWVRAFLVVMVSGIGFYHLNKGAIKAFEAATS